MSVDYYQRIVNSLDKEIADLEKKKATSEKKSADELKRASSININKNASSSMVRSKLNQIDRHKEASRKAASESASITKKIADKRKKRNDAYLKLQKEQWKEQEKHDKKIKDMQRKYEEQINDLSNQMQKVIMENTKSDVVASSNEESPEYDVFISHAWEDKEDFVEEFVQELESLGVKVWYDKNCIKWGDSMRAKIDEGLKKSRFGIAVLSPSYIADGKYWTKAELDGLFQLESINGKTLLPVWHKLTKKEVMEYSPIIGGKLAMNTASMTSKEIAENLLPILKATGIEE